MVLSEKAPTTLFEHLFIFLGFIWILELLSCKLYPGLSCLFFNASLMALRGYVSWTDEESIE